MGRSTIFVEQGLIAGFSAFDSPNNAMLTVVWSETRGRQKSALPLASIYAMRGIQGPLEFLG
jgi:hypothetical protein